MSGSFHFPRKDLADRIAGQCSSDPLLGSLSGIFLAAPRRTGKSTFLRRDLVPALIDADKMPVYVDLWEDRSREPSRILRSGLTRVIEELRDPASKGLDKSRILRISALGFSVGLAEPKPFDGTITEALERIGAESGKDVVLIVDEAQQALASDAGMDAMFALKAARDAMNQRDTGSALFLILTGSHRDKLAALVLGRKAPFYGGTVRDFPVLGADFADAVTDLVNGSRNEDAQISADDVRGAFSTLAHRPELLLEAIRAEVIDTDLSGQKADITQRALGIRDRAWAEIESTLDGLTKLQRAVLEALLADGDDFTPYAADMPSRLASMTGAKSVSKGGIQKALESLREKNLIWQPGSGRYAVEDQDLVDWHAARQSGDP